MGSFYSDFLRQEEREDFPPLSLLPAPLAPPSLLVLLPPHPPLHNNILKRVLKEHPLKKGKKY